MRMLQLGQTDLTVSEICLGSMTWGSQNTESQGHAQIDMALDRGINFIDTAEMYPVNPVRAETVGRTEEIIGTWNAKTGRRNDVIIATKVSGAGMAAVRDGAPISRATITEAFEASLKRLQTDMIDIYQLHWPNRGSYHFRQFWSYDASAQNKAEVIEHMDEVLDTLDELVKAGKLRHFGLSNETAWGTAQWLQRAEVTGGPRVETIQNEYSLLCRLYDSDLAELGVNEQVTLLAYTPLAAGFLSGKYAGDVTPPLSRRSINDTLNGRITPRSWAAATAYIDLARKHGLDPVQMAVAFVMSRPFPVVPIIGATSTAQLETILGTVDVTLSDEVLADIEEVHKAHPLPF
ncbi:aldo/keto reductase [Actibacterium mucosum KCTC 23349]|uniref:Aldo/keto reductase n=1 Tax=Actibacterium mucosum KCTC 23349 TaxID=1454373 RepID=A0A037ZKI9_9RHOB|nr:aldo/keto reductase [Actibacterium mucosum]KAJ55331.1 aldo/keto reductase [Actibacterium mucosum KCTC 23349]